MSFLAAVPTWQAGGRASTETFVAWVSSELRSGLLLGTALIGYGKALFYGAVVPLSTFSLRLLIGVRDRFERSKLAAGWGILTRWEEEEPVDRSMVMPEALFKAAGLVGLLWRWAVLRSCHPFEFSRAASWRNPRFEKRDLILP